MYLLFACEFGWTISEINAVPFDHACELIQTMNEGNVTTSTRLLGDIKGAIWAWLGIKETDTDTELAGLQSAGLPVNAIPAEAFEAWNKAGMPSPPERFFAKWTSDKSKSESA